MRYVLTWNTQCIYTHRMDTTKFREFRERHGLTQGQFGVALGIEQAKAQSRISHYESGRRDIPTDIAYRFIDYADGLGERISLEDIYPRQLAAG